MKLTALVKSGLHLVKLILSLGVIWLTLGLKVRKARKNFEKELVKAGIPKQVAKRLGRKYASIKDEVLREIKGAIWRVKP